MSREKGVSQLDIMLECSTGELLTRAAFMHHDDQGHDALEHHAVLGGSDETVGVGKKDEKEVGKVRKEEVCMDDLISMYWVRPRHNSGQVRAGKKPGPNFISLV